MEVKRDRGEQLLLIHEGKDRPKVSSTGTYDSDLLCATCDGILGRWEDYAFRLFKRLRSIKGETGSFANMGAINGDMVLRFAAGIAWKYSATQPRLGRISIGSYADLLKDVALGGKQIPSSLDVAVVRLVELDGDVYFYREPLPARHGQINSVRFSVGSFVVYLKIDQRPNDRTLPSACWLKNRSDGEFLIAPAELFDEGKLHRKLAGLSPVREFFGNMRSRQAQRREK